MAVQKCCPDDSIYNCDFYQMMQNETDPCFDDAISLTSANVNSGLDPYFLYYTCRLDEPETMANYRSAAMRTHLRKIGMTEATVTCSSYDDFTNYLNRNDVRRALNIPSVVPKYESCSDEISNTYDLTVTHLISQQQNVKKLVDAQKKKPPTIGFVTQYEGLDFLTVRGAGHFPAASSEKPKEALQLVLLLPHQLLQRFLSQVQPHKCRQQARSMTKGHIHVQLCKL
ncbi:hypothetical protein Q1695_000774 [Nippostrongylus brasiliensis]|nr:hypothetical protein Q1695_000774 [Nippostrongylus brasiliensis]